MELSGSQNIRQRALLCVEDEPDARDVLQEALPEYRIVFARTAFEALRSLHNDLFDGYVLDYWLPGWSGVQLCREVRKNDEHGPVIFASAATRDIDRRRAVRAGATVYFCKPLDPQMMRERLQVLMTLADVESLAAKPYAEDVLQSEIERCALKVTRLGSDAHVSAAAIERAVQANVYKVFANRRGTRANFQRWWPQMFAAAIANHEVMHGAVTLPTGPLRGEYLRGTAGGAQRVGRES